MRQTQLFTKTRKEAPADEVSKNAELLIKAGFVHKEMAGVYSYLPLGLMVLKKIENIIREEMNAIGGQEITMTSLQEKETWEPTDQWNDANVDVWFKTKLKNDTELGLAVTHEAPMTKMLKGFVQSYRDLPKYVYQFQTKFRNETRAKSGIMRTREFVMKDLYSFDLDEASHLEFYEKAKVAYTKIFKRVGIGHVTYLTFASGGMFSKFSHEFQTLTGAGEDTIYVDESKGIAINKEVNNDEVLASLGIDKTKLVEQRAVEVGNIFTLGTRFSDALDLKYQTESGDKKSVFMGSYGIGPGRLMGTVVEVLSDDKGIIWPESIAPFAVHLLVLGEDKAVRDEAEKTFKALSDASVEVLFDDRSEVSPGEKFADADLLGMPYRVVVSVRSIKDGGVELKKRTEEKGKIVTLEELCSIKFTN
ncbi:MAG: prolyl-tRNA synthetase [Candidatus Pacebacteria bacterium]|nr:prolyl-tRNA synthetase [Candidatus Paceibacterota bacterium]